MRPALAKTCRTDEHGGMYEAIGLLKGECREGSSCCEKVFTLDCLQGTDLGGLGRLMLQLLRILLFGN